MVGAAYFLIGVIIPVFALSSQGALSNFTPRASSRPPRRRARRRRAACHHLGVQDRRAACLRNALVFGARPLVKLLVSMVIHPPKPLSTR